MLKDLGTIDIYNVDGSVRLVVNLNTQVNFPSSRFDQAEAEGEDVLDALRNLVQQMEEMER